MKENKNTNGLIVALAIGVFVIALLNFSVIYLKISSLNKEITGFASGYVNITVQSKLAINLTNATILWGPGSINSGEVNATLFTKSSAAGSVSRGNWSGNNASGILIENIGNINTTLEFKAGLNAAQMFGNVGQQEYKFNVSTKSGEGTCRNNTALNTWVDVNTSGTIGTLYCSQFGYESAMDEVWLNVLLTVPYNTTNISSGGVEVFDTITITASAA